MVEGDRLESGYSGKLESWVRIPPSPPAFAASSFRRRSSSYGVMSHLGSLSRRSLEALPLFGEDGASFLW